MAVTLLTDFDDFYVGAMKGVILERTDEVVDIYHEAPRQDVEAAAFALLNTAPYFPDGTVHCIVVDPGVGTERKAVAVVVDDGRQVIVAPDNGVALPAARAMGKFTVHEIRYESPESSTFHGRDVFAPAAAEIAEGNQVYRESEMESYTDLRFGEARETPEGYTAEVIYVDSFGNSVTNLDGEEILNRVDYGDEIEVDGERIPFRETYAEVNKGEVLATIGSHENLEVSVNRGSAANELSLNRGDEVDISVAE